MNYQIINVGKKNIGIVWRYKSSKPQIEEILLPCSREQLIKKIKNNYPDVSERSITGNLARKIAKIYAGEKVDFGLSFLNLSKVNKFAAKVLKQTCRIPRGKVASYSELALKIGSPRAARAVGTALANNPFPLVIPCHRVVRSGGFLGNFGGGVSMKKELLKREGVKLDKSDKVCLKTD